MIRWTGLAPWEFEFPFPGSLTSTSVRDVLLMQRRFAGGRHTLTLFKAFHYQGHYCIVTELLGSSLYLALKKVKFFLRYSYPW